MEICGFLFGWIPIFVQRWFVFRQLHAQNNMTTEKQTRMKMHLFKKLGGFSTHFQA